jgi:hypothetical protein
MKITIEVNWNIPEDKILDNDQKDIIIEHTAERVSYLIYERYIEGEMQCSDYNELFRGWCKIKYE